MDVFDQIDLPELTLAQLFQVNKVRKVKLHLILLVLVLIIHYSSLTSDILQYLRSLREGQIPALTPPDLHQSLLTPVSLLGPLRLIEDRTFISFVDRPLKTNDEPLVNRTVNFFIVLHLESLERYDDSIDLSSRVLLEDRGTHQSPFFSIVENQITYRTKRILDIRSTYHRTHSLTYSLSSPRPHHVLLNRCLPKNFTRTQLYILL